MALISLEVFLGDFAPPVRAVTERLVALIQRVVPEASISVKPSWRCLAFTDPQVGYFCGVFPTNDLVRVGFEFGVLLPDPRHVLVGSGSQLRYFEIAMGESLSEAELTGFLEAAIALPSEAATRRAMVRSPDERSA